MGYGTTRLVTIHPVLPKVTSLGRYVTSLKRVERAVTMRLTMKSGRHWRISPEDLSSPAKNISSKYNSMRSEVIVSITLSTASRVRNLHKVLILIRKAIHYAEDMAPMILWIINNELYIRELYCNKSGNATTNSRHTFTRLLYKNKMFNNHALLYCFKSFITLIYS